MNIRYRVELNEAERAQLMSMLSGGKHAVRKLKRAQILLAADAGVSDEAIASSVSVGGSRRDYCVRDRYPLWAETGTERLAPCVAPKRSGGGRIEPGPAQRDTPCMIATSNRGWLP
jgi:hypothetical protein